MTGAIVDGDVPADERRERAAELLGVPQVLVDAALAYYADVTDGSTVCRPSGSVWPRGRKRPGGVTGSCSNGEVAARGDACASVAETLRAEGHDVVAVALAALGPRLHRPKRTGRV